VETGIKNSCQRSAVSFQQRQNNLSFVFAER